MKLSDIKGERTIEVIADLIEPVANLAQDETFKKLFKQKELPKGADAKQFALNRIKEALPKLLKEHKDDIVAILATIDGVPSDEYAEKMSLASVLLAVMELITDDEFLSFLSSLDKTPK